MEYRYEIFTPLTMFVGLIWFKAQFSVKFSSWFLKMLFLLLLYSMPLFGLHIDSTIGREGLAGLKLWGPDLEGARKNLNSLSCFPKKHPKSLVR